MHVLSWQFLEKCTFQTNLFVMVFVRENVGYCEPFSRIVNVFRKAANLWQERKIAKIMCLFARTANSTQCRKTVFRDLNKCGVTLKYKYRAVL